MSSPRHQSREVAFQILYRHDQQTQASSKGASSDPQAAPPPKSDAETDFAAGIVASPAGALTHRLAQELSEHFEHFHVPPELREFAALLAAGTITHARELDELLEKHASNWRVSRMSLIDRNLLRMAVYELVHVKNTPPSVVLDETIELAKQFGTKESPAFINGVLDAIKTAVASAHA